MSGDVSRGSVGIPLILGGLMLALFLGSELRWAGQPGFPLDDAWIHAVFARNLVEGRGFSFNAGEPIGGSTSPLWTVAMAGMYSLTHQMVWGTKALGALLYLAGILLAYSVVLKLTEERATAVLAGVLVALLRWNAWGAVGGMEIALYVALCLAGFYFYLAAGDSPPSLWRDLMSTLCLSCASLARPESIALLMTTRLMAVTDQLRGVPALRDLPRRLTGLAPHLLVFALVLTPWAWFNYQTVGTLVPNTFNAKVGTQNFLHAVMAHDVDLAKKSLLAGPVLHVPILALRLLATNALLFPFAALGFYRLWVGSGAALLHSRSRLLPAACVLYPAAMSLVEPTARLAYRYITNLLVLYCLMGAVGFVDAWRHAGRSPGAEGIQRRLSRFVRPILAAGTLVGAVATVTVEKWRPYLSLLFQELSSEVTTSEYERIAGVLLRPVVLGATALAGFLWVLMMTRRARAAVLAVGGLCVVSQVGLDVMAARRHAIQVKNINSLHIATGEWIDRHLPRDVTVALDDIGGITYASRRRIVDMVGLVSPKAIAYRKIGRSRVQYLRAVRPDYVATIHPRAMDEAPELFRPIHLVTIGDNIASANDTMVVFETVWNRDKR